MAKIQINEFKGVMPKVANDKLPINMAQTAADLKTATGELVAFRRSTSDTDLTGSSYKTFFEYLEGGNSHWVYYDLIVNWVRSPIANDSFERMYLTGADDTNGKYMAFVNDLQGVGTFDFTTDFYFPGAPSAAALVADNYASGALYRAYFYTYVSRYGEEGPPSAITEITDYTAGASVDLNGFTEPAAADEHLKTVVDSEAPAIRIYRTSTDGAGNATFLLVAEVAVDNTGPGGTAWAAYEYVDSITDSNLGSACTSALYDRAPVDLTGLRGHPNGFFVAHKDNVLYFSEPFHPYAWPEDYQIPIDHTIVGIGIFGSTIVVATDGQTYTYTGPHPTSLYKTKLAFQPCLSQRAVIETDDGVMFPSPEGFQHVTASGMDNVTKDLFRPEDWVNFELETMDGTWYNKAYYGFYKSADFEGHLIIDFLNGSITTGLKYHYDGYVSLADGKYYTIVDSSLDDPGTLYISQWDADPSRYRNYSYKSPRFILEKPKNFKVAQVILDSDFLTNLLAYIESESTLTTLNNAAWTASTWGEEDLFGTINGSMVNEQDINGDNLFSLSSLGVQSYVDFKVYADGVLKFTKQVMNSNIFKLPRGFKDKKWEIVVEGMIPVKRITMATSTEEIV